MGTAKVQGQPLNGYVDVSLVYPSTTGSYIALPGSGGHLPVVNGTFAALTLEGNDTLLPRGTYYQFTYSDAYGKKMALLNYVITGSTFDIGAAVPTPVTTNNVNFLDLLGIRNMSVQNLTVGTQIQIGTTIFSASGLTGAKQVNGVMYAQYWQTGSTTCGVQEAIGALPSSGGTVMLPQGGCIITSGITISKPVRLVGYGSGSATYPSVLIENAGTFPMVTVAPASTTALNGVTLSDFALLGAGSGSGGDNVLVNGGTAGVANFHMERVVSIGASGAGAHLTGLVTDSDVNSSYLINNTGAGVLLDATSGASPTRITLSNTQALGSGGDGLQMNGATVGLVTCLSSSFLNSGTNGVEVTSTATVSTFHSYGCTFGNNVNAGVLLSGGFGHSFDSDSFPVGVHQQYGLYANYAGSGANVNQFEVKDSILQNNLTDDWFIGASVTNALIYPQTVALTDTTVHTSISGSAGVYYIAPTASPVCSGSPVVCYQMDAAGYIREWGTFSMPTSGGTLITGALSFPLPFPTAIQSLVVTGGNQPDGAQDAMAVYFEGLSTSGATIVVRCSTNIGGSGCGSISNSVPANWQAIGH